MSVNTAITIFVNKVVEERRIPFTIGKEEDARRMRLLDRLTGAWKEDGETGNLVRSIRDARSFGNTRHTKDF
jgi:antitoxin component of RelBE/YafQ-DinJ toxin-antitoxin module